MNLSGDKVTQILFNVASCAALANCPQEFSCVLSLQRASYLWSAHEGTCSYYMSLLHVPYGVPTFISHSYMDMFQSYLET